MRILSIQGCGLLLPLLLAACSAPPHPAEILSRAPDTLAVAFDGKSGQVEVGGVYAGVEFHGSRPVPSRISFYYPVANSIDLSTDYWKRGESRPLTLTVMANGQADTLGASPWAYRWTPYRVVFQEDKPEYEARLEYHFAEDLPVVVMQLTLRNSTRERVSFKVESGLATTLHTSHAYVAHEPNRQEYLKDGFVASFDAADTDSVALFVANVGEKPEAPRPTDEPWARFAYARGVEPGDSLVITQVIGTARQSEVETTVARAHAEWAAQINAYEDGIRRYVRDKGRFDLQDPELRETHRLSKALLRANRHYLDGKTVPMPSPAEYNFFFTHDLLLTDLGAVYFDTDRVRGDLQYVQSLVGPDSILPHARYWRDSTYVIEPANADNWNHLWAVIVSASYLKHSGDRTTVGALYPTLQKSMELMLGNERDGLMYAERPDWWDIGHVYGPRAYLTSLTVRALEAYAYISMELGLEGEAPEEKLEAAARMRRALTERLWDENAGYLLNGLDAGSMDRHYYTGSLMAAAYDHLDPLKRDRLLETAGRELLDEQVGVRNAMPADFHLLVDRYKFLEGEVGAPFLYMNGGVWPQGNAWYAMGLITAGQVDEAASVLKKYLSVAGVTDSPNGQPAFYEYRNADPESASYGAVDKPTFLWAGGWYLHVLYQLGGVRETAWNLSFSPNLAEGFENTAYEFAIGGRTTLVSWSGTGESFRSILVDGVATPSAVVLGPSTRIELERGLPEKPYLVSATCIVNGARLRGGDGSLSVELRGVIGQQVVLEVIGPVGLAHVTMDGEPLSASGVAVTSSRGIATTTVSFTLRAASATVRLSPPVATVRP